MIHLRTFGLVDLRDSDGVELATILAQPKRLALLIYLAAARPAGVHRRDRLLALFWPELDEPRARDALNQSLRFLRKALGSGTLIRRSAEDVGIDPTELWCDVAAFRAAAEEEHWDDALELYRADFLQGFFVDGGAGFERWMEEEREDLRRLASRGARELARRHEESGALTLAISWGRRVLEFTPDDERAVRQLLALHVRAGDHAGALHLYDDFARRLEAEWDTAPAPETRHLIGALRSGSSEELAAVVGPLPGSDGNGDTPRQDGGEYGGPITGRYRIDHKLGTGGTATVYLARDLKHDRDVALKILLPEITEGLARDRFVREIRIAGQLQHPGIVPLFDSGEEDGRLYYVMPVVRGETLRRRLRRGPLDLPEVLTILREVADSLGYAHDHGVVHRDIKPENILLVGPRAVVSDFGIARAAEAARTPTGAAAGRLTRPGTSLGTPAYMAPEQAAGDPHITHLADLYSLGVLGYEMLAGHPPFTGSTPQEILAAKLTEAPADLLELRPDAPLWLADLLMRCLERDPTRRPQSARSIVSQVAADRNGAARRLSPFGRLLRRAGRAARPATIRRWGLGVAATAMLAAILWGAVSFSAAPVDRSLVAVLPFRVTGNGTGALEELREGVVDLTAIYLTGEQGGLRAVEPASLFRAWRERVGEPSGDTDPASRDAIAIARSLGAGWVLRGSLIATGDDVLLRASLAPVGRGRAVQASVTGTADSLLAFVPRLLGRLLAQLDGMPADQSRSLTTTSLSAVRAYLAGQHHYRHGEYTLAVDRFSEAISIDTSFALAGLGLLMAQEWAGNASAVAERDAKQVAWRHRDRLGARDRALIEAVLGPRGLEHSALADVHLARERATIVAPDRFESWYLLGDHLFHVGLLLGIDRSLGLAEGAFRRALTLDPAQAGVLQHLLLIAARRGDTAAVRSRWADYRATVPDPAIQFKDEWLVGQLLGDSALVTEALAGIDGSPEALAGLQSLAFNVSLFPGLVSPLRELLDRAAPVFERRDQRDVLARYRWSLALDAGRPQDARRIRVATGAISDGELALAQLIWGADSTDGPSPVSRLLKEPRECGLGLAYAQSNQWDRVRETRERVTIPSPTGYGPPITAKQVQVCRAALEAALAQGTNRPEARRLVLTLDSLLMTVPYLQLTWENLIAARLLEREGEYRRAAAAAARHRVALGYPSYLSTSLREAGRLAALAGDREQAIAHYSRYLALRSNPEPTLAAEDAEVRQALAELTGSAP